MTELDWLKSSPAVSPGDAKVQGSEAWLAWRGKGLGSSDAPVLLGWSPYKTTEELIREKRGTWKQEFGPHQQSAMDRGKRLEPKIRAWYEAREKASFTEDTAEDVEHLFLRASFDGLNRTIKNHDGTIGRALEIKAPNAKDHESAKAGFIPSHYEPQCQWLMMIGRLPWLDYVSYGSDDTYAVVSMRADPVMQNELLSRSFAVWALVKSPGLPIPDLPAWIRPVVKVGIDLGSADETAALLISPSGQVVEILNLEAIGEIPTIKEQETEQLAAETLAAQAAHVAAEARYEALKERLKLALGERKKAYCGEAVLEWQEKKGNVDYGKIPELKGVDLELYRKKPTKAFLFKRREGREP